MGAHDQLGAVVNEDLRRARHEALEVARVGGPILAPLAIDLRPVLGDQRRRNVVLRRERVRGAQSDLRAALAQRANEVRGLGGDMQARRDPQTRERALGGEALAHRA